MHPTLEHCKFQARPASTGTHTCKTGRASLEFAMLQSRVHLLQQSGCNPFDRAIVHVQYLCLMSLWVNIENDDSPSDTIFKVENNVVFHQISSSKRVEVQKKLFDGSHSTQSELKIK